MSCQEIQIQAKKATKFFNPYWLSIPIVLLMGYNCSNKSATGIGNDDQDPINTTGTFFDDFIYENGSDPLLTGFGWTIRTGGGGPGPPDCIWDKSLVTFIADTSNTDSPNSTDGNRLMKLSASTQGSGATCHQSEIYSLKKFQRTTFAAQVMFTDSPDMGSDGDGVVQTFFTIADWATAYTDAYCEFDFEYLPNGGWGVNGATLWESSWETVENHRSSRQDSSHAGTWQTLVIQADTMETKYYVNGELGAHHKKPYVVDGLMSINFNHWFIREQLKSSNTNNRQYSYCVDWVFAQTDTVLSPENVENRVNEIRSKGYPRLDTVNE
jgi:hypothetical protein